MGHATFIQLLLQQDTKQECIQLKNLAEQTPEDILLTKYPALLDLLPNHTQEKSAP